MMFNHCYTHIDDFNGLHALCALLVEPAVEGSAQIGQLALVASHRGLHLRLSRPDPHGGAVADVATAAIPAGHRLLDSRSQL